MELALVVGSLARPGGTEAIAARTAAGLARRGHHVAVYTSGLQPELWPQETELAGLVRLVGAAPPGRRSVQARAVARVLAPELARWPLVYAHGDLGLYWAAATKAPLAWLCQEPARRLYPALTEGWSGGAAAVHPALAAGHRRRGWKARGKEILERRFDRACAARARSAFVNSAYSASLFQRVYGRRAEVLDLGMPLPQDGNPPPAAAAIGAAASGQPHKNLHGLLHLASAMAEPVPWHIWGPGTDGADFLQLRARLGLEGRVHLHGFVGAERLEQLWRQVSLFVYLPLGEPFGLAGVEALLRGVPVLASDHGGPAEWLRRCGGGRSADPLQPELAAAALREMLHALAMWQAQAGAARARAATLYALPRYLERTEELLAAAV